jgi:anti-sigma factor (TIGR02949 family)
MDCRNALAKLYDYIDGEIGQAEREAIAAHIEACRGCFDQFETERLFADFIDRRVPRPAARAEFKEHLLARLAEEALVRHRPSASSTNIINLFNRFAIAAGLILTVGVGAAWLQGKTAPERLPWRTLAGYHHERIEVEEVGIETSDYNQARAFLTAQMNPGVGSLLPESVPPGVQTHESCVMPWQDGKLGRFAFDGDAGEISLFIIPASACCFSDEPRIRVDNRDYRSVKLGCCRAICWDEGGEYVCVMLGDCHANDLLAYAQSWQSANSRHSSGGSSLSTGNSAYTADSGR